MNVYICGKRIEADKSKECDQQQASGRHEISVRHEEEFISVSTPTPTSQGISPKRSAQLVDSSSGRDSLPSVDLPWFQK